MNIVKTQLSLFQGAGYVYIIFDQESSVRNLLIDCAQQSRTIGQWFFNLKCKKQRNVHDLNRQASLRTMTADGVPK